MKNTSQLDASMIPLPPKISSIPKPILSEIEEQESEEKDDETA
jgi:hypothetical protein